METMTLFMCRCVRGVPKLLSNKWARSGQPNTDRRWMGLVTRNWGEVWAFSA